MSENNKDNRWKDGGPIIGGWEVGEWARESERNWNEAKCGLMGFVVVIILLGVVISALAIGLWHMFGWLFGA